MSTTEVLMTTLLRTINDSRQLTTDCFMIRYLDHRISGSHFRTVERAQFAEVSVFGLSWEAAILITTRPTSVCELDHIPNSAGQRESKESSRSFFHYEPKSVSLR